MLGQGVHPRAYRPTVAAGPSVADAARSRPHLHLAGPLLTQESDEARLFFALFHAALHNFAGPDTACVFLQTDPHTRGRALCPNVHADLREAVERGLDDAGVDIVELVELIRLDLPDVVGHEHVLLVPLRHQGESHGAVALAAAAPPPGGHAARELMTLGSELVGRLLRLEEERRLTARTIVERDELARRLDEVSLALDMHQHLVDCIAPPAVVHRLGEVLHSAVALQSPRLIVLEYANTGNDIVLSPTRGDLDREVAERAAREREPLLVAAARGIGPRLVVPVVGNGDLLAYLVIEVAPGDEARARVAGAEAAPLLAHQLLVREGVDQSTIALRQDLFLDLLDGRQVDRALERAGKLGHDLREPHVPLVLSPLVSTGDSSCTLTRLPTIVTELVREGNLTRTEPLVGTTDSVAIAFVPGDVRGGITQLAKALKDRVSERGIEVRIAVGPVCANVDDYRGAVEKAMWVVDVLELTGQSRRVARYDDLGVYGLLFDRGQAAQLEEFVTRWIGPLVEYDNQHRAELTKTLQSYFEHGSMAETAHALHVHISTLKYRVKRIEEILGVELDDTEVAFNLQLATKILAVRQKLATSDRV